MLLDVDVRLQDVRERRYAIQKALPRPPVVDAHVLRADGVPPFGALVFALTWAGHDFLAATRNNTIWAKTKQVMRENAGDVPFALVQAQRSCSRRNSASSADPLAAGNMRVARGVAASLTPRITARSRVARRDLKIRVSEVRFRLWACREINGRRGPQRRDTVRPTVKSRRREVQSEWRQAGPRPPTTRCSRSRDWCSEDRWGRHPFR
jgi:hypothetical protein